MNGKPCWNYRTLAVVAAIGVMLVVSAAVGQVQIVESFEDTSNPADWRQVSPAPQTQNAINESPALTYVTDHVTHGAQAARFEFNWVSPGIPAASNPYEVDGPLLFWSMRLAPMVVSGLRVPLFNQEVTSISADIHNNTSDTIQVAFLFAESDNRLERTPLTTLAPYSRNTLTFLPWSEPVTSFITGSGRLDIYSYYLRGILLYSEIEPTQGRFSMDVDNIRAEKATTTWYPDSFIPRILSARQGSAPGKLRITWEMEEEDIDY